MENLLSATSYDGQVALLHSTFESALGVMHDVRVAAATAPHVAPNFQQRGATPTAARQGNLSGPVFRSAAEANGDAATPRPVAKRPRRERGPNWLPQEILALIDAKRSWHQEELDMVDSRDLMTPEAHKWISVSQIVAKAGFSPCLRDGPACKGKWHQLLPEYKKLADYFARSGINSTDYWCMTPAARKAEGLPRCFPEEFYFSMHSWMGLRPCIQPPHARDLLSAGDSNYSPTLPMQEQPESDSSDQNDSKNPIAIGMAQEGTNPTTPISPPVRSLTQSTPSSLRKVQQRSQKKARSPAVHDRVAGDVPTIDLSSSHHTEGALRRSGSTAVRRKTASGHSLIAEATRIIGEKMAGQMKDMAQASIEIEKSKMSVQMELFKQQLEYQRERDRRLYESSKAADENAKKAIDKQGEVVHCLSNLTNVLAIGLQRRSEILGQRIPRRRQDLSHLPSHVDVDTYMQVPATEENNAVDVVDGGVHDVLSQ